MKYEDRIKEGRSMAIRVFGLVAMIAFIVGVIIGSQCGIANAAESDSLYYVSATDMMAKVDSIEQICDTTEKTTWIPTCQDSLLLVNFGYAAERIRRSSYDPSIWEVGFQDWVTTCREVIRIVKVKELVTKNLPSGEYGMGFPDVPTYHPGGIYVVSPGQMVVWWEKVEGK